MAHKKRGRKEADQIHLGFQIAPMIDVVFVIMLFFMVMAGAVQKEHELNLKLPGAIPLDGEPPAIEETQVRVLDTGEILLNEDPVADETDTRLKEFAATMIRLKESSKVAETEVVVTIMADEFASFQRVIDVLNALSIARIEKVTFEVPPN